MNKISASHPNKDRQGTGGQRVPLYPLWVLLILVGLLVGVILIALWDTGGDRAPVRFAPAPGVLPTSHPLALTVEQTKVTLPEGEVATNGGRWTGSGEDAPLLRASLGEVRAESDGRWSWSYRAADGPDASQPVTITVQDGRGPGASVTFQLLVENLAPLVSLSAERLVEPGNGALGHGSFVDPGADTWQATVDYGDGAGPETLPLAADGTLKLAHAYREPGEYSLVVCVRDDDGGQGCASHTVTVAPRLPGFGLHNRSGPIREGETALLAFSRPGGAGRGAGKAGWRYSYDCTGDGLYEVEDDPRQWLYRCFYPESGTYTAYGRVKGARGAQIELQVEVQVDNVAPTARFEANPATAREGESVRLVFSQATDASPEDLRAGLRYAYDCDGDGVYDLEEADDPAYACSYPESGTYAARGRISDRDGGWNEYRAEVLVERAVPSIRLAVLAEPAYEGVPVQLAFVEPAGSTPVQAYSFDCTGDGVYVPADAGTASYRCLYPEQGTYTARGRRVDVDGNETECEAEVVVHNAAPTATLANVSHTIQEGGSVVLTLRNPVDTNAGDVYSGFRYSFDCTGDGVFDVTDTPLDSYLCGYDDDGLYLARARIADRDGDWSEYTVEVRVLNAPPQATLPDRATVDEGQSYALVLSSPRDPSPADTAAGFRYDYDCDGDGTFEVVDQGSGKHTCTYPDDGSFLSRARIRDVDGAESVYTIRVTARNVTPTVGAIAFPTRPFLVGSEIEAVAAFSDPGVLDVHSARWAWGDDRVSSGRVQELSGSGSVSGTHAYLEPGLYWVRLQVSDGDGGLGESPLAEVPVYDPAAGAVAGELRFASPPGAYARNPAFSRQAWLSFSGQYPAGASDGTPPEGWVQFELSGGGMQFEAHELDWLVVAGEQVWLAGTGTVNGVGRYGLSIALDLSLDPGRVRVRVWDQEGHDAVLYDSQPGAAHEDAPTTPLAEGEVVLPNP